jgi:hypothetical protein
VPLGDDQIATAQQMASGCWFRDVRPWPLLGRCDKPEVAGGILALAIRAIGRDMPGQGNE